MEATPASGFVIALCTLDRAIPIPQPRSAPLNRYRFFLTRRNTEGREYFVLHMGTFESAADAEKMVAVLRRTYPNAYVSDSSEPAPMPPLMSDTQVMRVLEVRPPTPVPPATPAKKIPDRPRTALDASLEDLADKESETGGYEALSDTGVRHLSIEVARKKSPRNRIR